MVQALNEELGQQRSTEIHAASPMGPQEWNKPADLNGGVTNGEQSEMKQKLSNGSKAKTSKSKR
jgi:hypothetical protein